MSNPSTWLKFGLFSVGLGQSFAFVLVPPLARDLGLSVIETSTIFSISAVAWAITSASWGRASDKFGRRNIAVEQTISLVDQNRLVLDHLITHRKTFDDVQQAYDMYSDKTDDCLKVVMEF